MIKKKEDKPNYKKVDLDKVNGRPYDIDENDGKAWVKWEPPLQVYCDYEATTDDDGYQTPILLCLSTDEDEEIHHFLGEDCTDNYLNI